MLHAGTASARTVGCSQSLVRTHLGGSGRCRDRQEALAALGPAELARCRVLIYRVRNTRTHSADFLLVCSDEEHTEQPSCPDDHCTSRYDAGVQVIVEEPDTRCKAEDDAHAR